MDKIKAGDIVKKIHIYDGSVFAGKPTGKSLKVLSIYDRSKTSFHSWGMTGEIAILENGDSEFIWNLVKL